MKIWVLIFLLIPIYVFGQEAKFPEYIKIIEKNDSVFLTVKNNSKVPISIVIREERKKSKVIIPFKVDDSLVVFSAKFENFNKDKLSKELTFNLYFGDLLKKSHDTSYSYLPPFKKGNRYKVIQGYYGRYSHTQRNSRHAIDFQMPIGDTICAARKGIVVSLEKEQTIGGKGKKFEPYANFILVYHEDGTFAQYTHLKHQGVFVDKGDIVEKGQAIGLSGNTGWSSEPHLHFSILKVVQEKAITIPFIFGNTPAKNLKKGIRINY